MLSTGGPTALACSRQGLPVLDRGELAPAEGLHKGAYVLRDAEGGEPDVILIASGSEVPLVLEAADALLEQGVRPRVVSFPSWELFEAQPQDYRDAVLPPSCPARVVVEAASPFGWERYAGDGGVVIGLDRFGASAPGKVVLDKLGFTGDHIVQTALELVKG
jgi:transketolase